MDFLERLSAEDRERLLAASDSLHLSAGQTLIRRGEIGGDIYWVEAGSIEVVDTRHRPELVLDVLGPGSVLGEMSFVDSAPRSADVRAVSDAICYRWAQAALIRLLDEDTELSARFYRALSGAVVDRSRRKFGSVVVGGIDRLVEDSGSVPVAVAQKAREITDLSRQRWMEAETRLRVSASDSGGLRHTREALALIVEAAAAWLGPMEEHARALDAGEALRREVQPYLGRAKLVFLAQEGGLAANGAEFMAHLLLGEPAGDGPMGEEIDRGLLALPTAEGVRNRQRSAVRSVMQQLPEGRVLKVTLIHPNCGALLAQLVSRLASPGAIVTVIDGDRETLGVVDLGMHKRPEGVELRLVQEDLALLASGRSSLHHEPQDVIVVDGLVDHLPDRLVVALASWCGAHLAPDGRLVLTGSAPASDAEFFDHLVGWPLMRRSAKDLTKLVDSAGLHCEVVPVEESETHHGAVVRAGRTAGSLPRS